MKGTERTWYTLLPWMTVYAIAMALLESAVVVDLRALYFPQGFRFPLVPIERTIAITELFRELATMAMLLAPGAMVTRRALDRFAWFLFCFGVWDIFYYVFLKVILGWPVTLLDWDILFLVPVPWVGPVLAPCIVALGMMLFGLLVLEARRRDPAALILAWERALLATAVVVMLYTFVEEPLGHALQAREQTLSVAASGDALGALHDYVPARFTWSVFLVGAGLAAAAMLNMALRWLRHRVVPNSMVLEGDD